MHILFLIFTSIAGYFSYVIFFMEDLTRIGEIEAVLLGIIAAIFAIGHGITYKLDQLIKIKKVEGND